MATCKECEYLDLKNYNSITGKYRCTRKGWYVLASSGACSSFTKKINDQKSDSCFLTTLATSNVNSEQNAQYLETLRGFRNNVMHGDEKYVGVLKEYDVLGPMICDRINEDPQKEQICETMIESFIKPTCLQIVAGNNDMAVMLYQKMVRDLQARYGILVNLDDYEYSQEVLEMQKGHGDRALVRMRTKQEN